MTKVSITHQSHMMDVRRVLANVTVPVTCLSIGPPSSSLSGINMGFGWGAWEGGSRPRCTKSMRAALSLSRRWFVSNICPNALCRLDRRHGRLTAVISAVPGPASGRELGQARPT